MVCGTQLSNYAMEIIQMTLESAWIYEIHYIQLKCVSIYRKEVKIIAITYFLATLPFLATKIAITLTSNRIDLKLVALDSHSNSASFGIFEVYFKQNNKNIIFTTIFDTFYSEIAVK